MGKYGIGFWRYDTLVLCDEEYIGSTGLLYEVSSRRIQIEVFIIAEPVGFVYGKKAHGVVKARFDTSRASWRRSVHIAYP